MRQRKRNKRSILRGKREMGTQREYRDTNKKRQMRKRYEKRADMQRGNKEEREQQKRRVCVCYNKWDISHFLKHNV